MDIRGMDNMAATAETAEMANGAEIAAEEAAVVKAETVKIAAGVVVNKRKVARIPNPAIRPLGPTTISV